MQPDYWHERWREGRIGFHRAEANPLLIEHHAAFDESTRVLVQARAWRAMWSHGRITIPSVCALLLIGACGGAAPPGAKGSGEGSDGEQPESSSAPCAQERARAVALAQAVEALGPPDVPPPGGKAESLAFMQGPLADWVRSRRAATDQLKPPPHLAYPRPFVPTSQPKPCAFAGTLKLWRPTLKLGSREVARVEQVEVSRLSLPSARSGAFVVQTAWPIRGTFTLEASALPLNLRSRVELSGKHVWLSRGAAVSAAEVGEGKALAYRPLGENAHVTPDPVAKVACSELELAGAAPPQVEDEKRSRVNFKGALPLSEAPGGRSIGNFTLREPEAFTLLERRSGWLHIRSSSTPIRDFGQRVPYDFEAWTQARPTDETGWGMIGLLNEATPATHESIAELALFVAPYAREPIGKLVKGVPLLVGETRQGFVNVVVPGMDATPVEASGFWAEKRAFDASVRAL